MPDGCSKPPVSLDCRRPLPRGSDPLGKQWLAAHRALIDAPPVELQLDDYTVACIDASPSGPEFRPQRDAKRELRIDDVVSQYTLRGAGIFLPGNTQLLPDDIVGLSVRDPTERARTKERNRKPRMRSRIVRDGLAPLLDAERFPPEHRWAVDRVNRVAIMRFTAPLTDSQRRCLWVDDADPIWRHVDLWIWRTIAKGSGRNKLKPETIVRRLIAWRDVPTPIGEDGVSDSVSDVGDLAARLASITSILETEK